MSDSTPDIGTLPVPTLGRIVLYTLSQADVDQILCRRVDRRSISERVRCGAWPYGAQAHIGSDVHAGDVYPMIIVRVWGRAPTSAVNGQVFLDGSDVLWVTSVTAGVGHGSFSWPGSERHGSHLPPRRD